MLVTEKNVAGIFDRLSRVPRLVMDTETTGLYVWHGARLCGIAVAIPPAPRKDCFYFPFRHEPGGNLSPRRLKQLIGILSRALLTGWNSNKFDTHMLMADGLPEPQYMEDVMLMLHLLNENERFTGGSYELKIAAAKYIDPRAQYAQLALKNLLMDRGLKIHEMWKLPPSDVERYASDDVYYTERLRAMMMPALDKEWGLGDIWREVNRYALISRRMEERGLTLDVPLMKRYTKEARFMSEELGQQIMEKSKGRVTNPNSNPQLQKWLGVPSVAKDALVAMGGKTAELITTYRQWTKVLSSYYVAYEQRMDVNRVLHPNIKLHGTISGRPSAEDPNLQAVPRATEVYKVKDVFIARPGHALISADYSQMELRLGAHYAKDEMLIEAFRTGKNVHQMTADDLGIPYFDAKRVNFAVIYGTGADSLAEEIGIPKHVAARFLREAHELHPNYRPLYQQIERHSREHGYLRLWTGRVRRFNMPDPYPWFHKSLSNLIQGGVAEVMRHAIMRLGQLDVPMLLQVHDQILFEVPRGQVKEAIPVIRREMTRDFPFSVPFVADIKVGSRWGTLKEVA